MKSKLEIAREEYCAEVMEEEVSAPMTNAAREGWDKCFAYLEGEVENYITTGNFNGKNYVGYLSALVFLKLINEPQRHVVIESEKEIN